MTDAQARMIRELRRKGRGYRAIGSMTGLSRDIVRNYCKARGLVGYAPALTRNIEERIKTGRACILCGNEIEQPMTGRPRKFCTDSCRREWWKRHPDAMNKREAAFYTLTCERCGAEFRSYGNRKRKYCCQECYVKDRFGRNKKDGVQKTKN